MVLIYIFPINFRVQLNVGVKRSRKERKKKKKCCTQTISIVE